MKITQTNLKGVTIIDPDYFHDSRGGFYESFHSEKYAALGIADPFLQDNVSISQKNVLRGLHFQKGQGQLVWCSLGKVIDVVVDIRPESSTYRKWISFDLDANHPKQIFMQDGIAHGFYVISDLAIMNYKCTRHYSPADEGGILWNDPDLKIQWQCDNPIVSERDRTHSTLNKLRQRS
jgi:dTDP-4-dehydrorhamnose 3,5-epimerase